MDNTCFDKGFKGSVNGDFIGPWVSEFFCDLVLINGPAGRYQCTEDVDSLFCFYDFCRIQELFGFFCAASFHCDYSCLWVCGWLCLPWTGHEPAISKSDFTNNSGKMISLMQQGSHTAMNRVTNIPIATAVVI